MHTTNIHGFKDEKRYRCVLPIIKLISHDFVVSGTLTAETPFGLKCFDLTNRWLKIEEENVSNILQMAQNIEDVWIQEKPNMNYSAIKATLPESHAAYYGLHLSERDENGRVIKGEFVVADEVIKHIYYPNHRTPGPQIKFDELMLDDAIQTILTTGDLPPRKKGNIDMEFGKRFRQ